MDSKIIHIDGDNFFVSCEIARNPSWRGRPVVTGHERGIASAMSPEAKRAGVTRGMPIKKALRLCPDLIVVPADFCYYNMVSQRMLSITRRFFRRVEKYSVDECFADVSDYHDVIDRMQALHDRLHVELGVSFSVGLGATKTIAKVASNFDKPNGHVIITPKFLHAHLKQVAIGDVWGIGWRTRDRFVQERITTANDFFHLSKSYVTSHLSQPHQALWRELHGEVMYPVRPGKRRKYHSMQKTRSFTPTSDQMYVFSQLSKNVEILCASLRRHRMITDTLYISLKTRDMQRSHVRISLLHPTNAPSTMLAAIREPFDSLYQAGVAYRKTGITASELRPESAWQHDWLGESLQQQKLSNVFKVVDHISHKYGRHSVCLGSSLQALKGKNNKVIPVRRIIGLPVLGIVR